MGDNEIIKALECCKTWNCEKCINRNRAKTATNCRNELVSEIFDLINRQKAEIERLKAEADELAEEYNVLMNEKDMLFDEAKTLIKQAKSEAIREFAENLKLKADKESVRELVNCGNYWGRTMRIPEDSKAYAISYKISEADLDDLVKEMTEGENG